jgi:medium-chain acyl-[acyl-carrier-protein] hydrolase
LRVFCFPYAGGSAGAFQRWFYVMPPGVDVCAVQMPGRANRMHEPALCNLPLLVSTLAQEISPWLDRPFVFFGHSLGALVSFELARYLQKYRACYPTEVVVSGCRAPQAHMTGRTLHKLPEPEFIQALQELGGTPDEILKDPRLMAFLAPSLRADLELFETYEYAPGNPLDCPITAFGGIADGRAPLSELSGWRYQTTSAFSLRKFPGGHFFLHESEALVTDELRHILFGALGRACSAGGKNRQLFGG